MQLKCSTCNGSGEVRDLSPCPACGKQSPTRPSYDWISAALPGASHIDATRVLLNLLRDSASVLGALGRARGEPWYSDRSEMAYTFAGALERHHDPELRRRIEAERRAVSCRGNVRRASPSRSIYANPVATGSPTIRAP